MTICVAIKVHDCIVFAADSAVTLSDERGIWNIWEHGSKVFNLHRELPVVATTAGMANFGSVSVNNLAKDLRLQLHEDINPCSYTIEQIANIAKDFFWEKYQAIAIDGLPSFSFFIGGYDSGRSDEQGEIWNFYIGDGVPKLEILSGKEEDCAIFWDGQQRPLKRLLYGFDEDALMPLFREWGWSQDSIDEAISLMKQQTMTLLVNPSMPVQDAINLADFLVNTAKGYSAFLPGGNTVGGETDIATVTKHEAFKWIKRKHYYPEHLNRNRGDIDHVQ